MHGHIWGEQIMWGRLVNAYDLHGPTRRHGERYAILFYTSALWARLTPAIQQGLLEMEFHWGDDM